MIDDGSSDIYAIADVHGRADLLEVLLRHIADTSAERQSKPTVIFLGDLIDRGPRSPQVLDLVASTLDLYPGSQLILGNHDFYLRSLLRGELAPEDAVNWMDWGGVATVSAYSRRPVPDFRGIAADIREAFPHHATLLDSALTYRQIGSFCFVHAGIRPGVSLAAQTDYDLRWIRAGFLDHVEAFEYIVVHGHTITNSLRPEVYDNRIAIDTAAYRTGRLSAAVIRHDKLSHFICTALGATGEITVENWRAD
ncbi:metallophosphoesterase [Rhizobium sp. S152]|uniref:metallophosphoesterase n=1 Tax=Rhizobium sp. S152 TaxID=3055038 RepID=UPI0025A9E690|nr:metallophosphoesterase [Rhizobium sp. S152]MDM9625384.1 metallophosphoesterase [Rhizobium sp. S152]